MTAIMRPDKTLEVPVSVTGPGLAADGTRILRPGDPGYQQLAATAIPADQHPLRAGRNPVRAAELDALFSRWDHRASA
jgi:hypothetical protein